MVTIVSAVNPEDAISILYPKICGRIKVFLNLMDSEEVFDYLWDNQIGIDLVVVEGSDLDARELHAASRERPQSAFIVIGAVSSDLKLSASNIVFIASPNELRQAVAKALD